MEIKLTHLKYYLSHLRDVGKVVVRGKFIV